MSDTSLNKIVQYGTDAARIAFTPSPAAGSKVLYIWYTTDTLTFYVWDGATWVTVGGGTGSLLTTIVTLNNAQIKALPTTPIALVPAPGAGKIIIPWRINLILKAGATPYTNINTFGYITGDINGNENVTNYIGNDDTIPAINQLTTFLTNVTGILATLYCPYADTRGDFSGWGLTTDPIDTSILDNQPLNLLMVNGRLNVSGDLTGGGGGNSLMVVTDYKVITLP